MTNEDIVSCPKCSQRVRLPFSRIPVAAVTCPIKKCGHKWHPAVPLRELMFYCSRSAEPFVVTYVKPPGQRVFGIRFIESDENGVVAQRLDLLRAAGQSRQGVPAVTFGPVESGEYDTSEFSHAGWLCPHCDQRGSKVKDFVRCGSCRKLYCGGTIIKIRNGPKTYHCPCGSGGEVSGKTIDVYRGIGVSVAPLSLPENTGVVIRELLEQPDDGTKRLEDGVRRIPRA